MKQKIYFGNRKKKYTLYKTCTKPFTFLPINYTGAIYEKIMSHRQLIEPTLTTTRKKPGIDPKLFASRFIAFPTLKLNNDQAPAS